MAEEGSPGRKPGVLSPHQDEPRRVDRTLLDDRDPKPSLLIVSPGSRPGLPSAVLFEDLLSYHFFGRMELEP
jgi:hypothetical protein